MTTTGVLLKIVIYITAELYIINEMYLNTVFKIFIKKCTFEHGITVYCNIELKTNGHKRKTKYYLKVLNLEI